MASSFDPIKLADSKKPKAPAKVTFGRLLRLAKPEWKSLALGTVFLLVGAVTNLVFPQSVRFIIDEVAGGKSLEAIDRVAAKMAVVFAILGKTFAPAPAATASTMSALLVEFLYTFALALVVLNSAASAKTHGNSFYGLAIGFTVVVGAFAGGPISGGAFNPAVGFGPVLVNAMLGEGTLGNPWLYWVGPLAGGAVASAVFGLQERDPLAVSAEPSRTAESRPA